MIKGKVISFFNFSTLSVIRDLENSLPNISSKLRSEKFVVNHKLLIATSFVSHDVFFAKSGYVTSKSHSQTFTETVSKLTVVIATHNGFTVW